MMLADKREYKRMMDHGISVDWKVYDPKNVDGIPHYYCEAKCINISSSGVCFRTDDFDPGTELIKMFVKLCNRIDGLIVVGKVLHYTATKEPNKYEVGVKFLTRLPGEWEQLFDDHALDQTRDLLKEFYNEYSDNRQ